MGIIQMHHTDTEKEIDWDAPAEIMAMESNPEKLQQMFAWMNDDQPPESRQSYKFAHHSHAGEMPANIRGVNIALAKLTVREIPDEERAAVEKHLRVHRLDAGLESNMSEFEFLRAVDHVAKMNDLNGTEKRALRTSVRRQEMDERHSLIQEPIRCFDGNAKPHEPFWALHNAAESETGEPEVEFYGPISEFLWMGDEITPKIFKDDLYRLGGKGPVTVRLNSPGGDLIASSVIRAIMLDYPGAITVKIDGLAASAAVMVALGGDRVLIQQSAYMMVHDPMIMLFMAALNINDLAELLTELKTVKRGIIEAYTVKTQLPPEKVAKLMSDETWMTAGDAVALGFADEVIGGISKPVNFVNALQKFNHVPPALLERIGAVDPIPDVVDDEKARQLRQLRAEVKLII